MSWHRRFAAVLAGIAVLLTVGVAQAARESNIKLTKHNLSSTGPGTLKADAEPQICVFCHTPHGSTGSVTPLWNRKLSTATYTPYSSNSLDAEDIQGALGGPGGSSKLCLSCHDGTMAIGEVNVLNGAGSATTQGTVSIAMAGTGAGGVMAPGGGITSGFTRNLGSDLSNDHPISVTYDKALADRDGELRVVDANQKWPINTGEIIGVRSPGYKPKLPLEPTGTANAGQIQCATCHDPHSREKNTAAVDYGIDKFLRLSRFQAALPTGAYTEASDIICLSCHDKGGTSWAYSAHARDLGTQQTYTAAAATQRGFPASLPVWQAACHNCHDTHTVSGSRRLLREGTNAGGAYPKTGGAGTSAIEETCYQCHDGSTTVLASVATVPNIKTDFATGTRMPIARTPETHDIGGNVNDTGYVDCTGPTNKCGKDFIESRALLGAGGALDNRHAECTDCHNPHRVVKFRDFRGNPVGNIIGTPDGAGTHLHTDSAMNHTNIASGVLRGSWGVEPIYSSASFQSLPSGFSVKRGDPGSSTDASVGAGHVTREYQICLKCHSDYGYSDNNLPQTSGGTGVGNRPTLGSPGTASGTNGATMYTNQAKEFQTPIGHAGPASNSCINAGTAAGAAAAYNDCNHRSWHPVMNPTGRTTTTRGMSGGNPWLAPWNNQVGSNTMYCSDCHGSGVTSATSVIPDGGENGKPWGPHGSTNDFILKGAWTDTGGGNAGLLCFKCHAKANYTTRNDTGRKTGFYDGSTGKGNLHNYHVDKMGKELRCTWCHVAVPHGWKNKALLVNLNDLGPEVGKTAGTAAPSGAYTNGPYYYKAVLRVTTFAQSGAWAASDCGGKDYMRGAMCGSPP